MNRHLIGLKLKATPKEIPPNTGDGSQSDQPDLDGEELLIYLRGFYLDHWIRRPSHDRTVWLTIC